MHDLDIRLERLAAEATRDAVPPEPEAIARRGRGRRRRQLAEREAVRARLERIDGVAKVTHESPEQAYRRLPEKLRRDGRDLGKMTPRYTPESLLGAFHITLQKPARTEAFHRALCGSRQTGACGGLVVLEHAAGRGQPTGAGSVRVRP